MGNLEGVGDGKNGNIHHNTAYLFSNRAPIPLSLQDENAEAEETWPVFLCNGSWAGSHIWSQRYKQISDIIGLL